MDALFTAPARISGRSEAFRGCGERDPHIDGPDYPAVLHNFRNIALGRLFAGSLLQTLVLRSNWRLFDVKSAKLFNTADYPQTLNKENTSLRFR